MTGTAVPPSFCTCGYFMDRAAAAPGAKKAIPAAGDLTICFSCGQLNTFDKDLKVVPFDKERLLDLPPLQALTILQAQVRIRQRGPIRRDELPS